MTATTHQGTRELIPWPRLVRFIIAFFILAGVVYVALAPLTRLGLQNTFFKISNWSAPGLPLSLLELQAQSAELISLLGILTQANDDDQVQTLSPPDREFLIRSIRNASGPALMLDENVVAKLQRGLVSADKGLEESSLEPAEADSLWRSARRQAVDAFFVYSNELRGYLKDWQDNQSQEANVRAQYAWVPEFQLTVSWYVLLGLGVALLVVYVGIFLRGDFVEMREVVLVFGWPWQQSPYVYTPAVSSAVSPAEDSKSPLIVTDVGYIQASLQTKGPAGRQAEALRYKSITETTAGMLNADTNFILAQSEQRKTMLKEQIEIETLQDELERREKKKKAKDARLSSEIAEEKDSVSRINHDKKVRKYDQEQRAREDKQKADKANKQPLTDEQRAEQSERRTRGKFDGVKKVYVKRVAEAEEELKNRPEELQVRLDELANWYESELEKMGL